ncbi:MAG TPA: tetratricopeptide repeat protein, partial [Kineobactrum sp.]
MISLFPSIKSHHCRGAVKFVGTALATALLTACAGSGGSIEIPADATVADLSIVDCLLPGQVRQLGNSTYLTPRRPVRTTAQDCRIRGGEYVAFDRADYKTALRVWLPAAESGDADAQNSVGEIFERGLGTEPNYEVAVLWFRRAAEQGHKGAQFNLGTLYETGKGVTQDKATALNWYRQAWGVSEDQLVYQSDAEQALLASSDENAALRQENMTLAQQIEQARVDRVRDRENARVLAAAAEQAKPAQSAVKPVEERIAKAPMVEVREPLENNGLVSIGASSAAPGAELTKNGRNYGRYDALVIGNGSYQYLDDLATPASDVDKISRL